MTSRERIRALIAGESADRCGFWLGNPHDDTWPIYHRHFRTNSHEELRLKLDDDFRWIRTDSYRSKGDRPFTIRDKGAHGTPGPFADATDSGQVDDYDWPDPDELDISGVLRQLENAGEFYRASGCWTPFYHDLMDLFGIEAYLMNMYENPAIVHAVTDRVCGYYYAVNERFFNAAGDLVDGFFFGNDFGTQRDLICGPAQFDEFVLPWFRRFTEQAHRFGHQVILHSCGSIFRVIDRLIDAGVDCLHPLQALAANMDADTLAANFKGQITFLGGIDTQDLLVNGSAEEVRADVRRVKATLGPRLIVSPSHEAILPNVAPENVQAMAEAAVG